MILERIEGRIAGKIVYTYWLGARMIENDKLTSMKEVKVLDLSKLLNCL